MFATAVFRTDRVRNQPRWFSVGGWEKKVRCEYIMGYYSFIKGMKDFHCGKMGVKDIKELI